jgi:DNA-binding MarR family transcriptional regulator
MRPKIFGKRCLCCACSILHTKRGRSFQLRVVRYTTSVSKEKYIVMRYNHQVDMERPSLPQIKKLAEFRHRLRLFLQFSENAAEKLGLQPQQHQLLLQIAGAPAGVPTTIRYAAERLGLRHNTAVELCNRCHEAGLIKRKTAAADRRCVLLELTPKGKRFLHSLSIDHALELNQLAPQLIQTLTELQAGSAGLEKQVPGGRE